ncbi:hypothetical protein JOF53_006995 [Crossiella equi]|uniref:Uncharacterized protein n=1 Tax=Crossiella equi TaxID=130796 RepID=A0ABS5ANG3_9PSEU|nr:hypothetical protein [Crossiella equi]MBP2478123.1 hypothetical protein [Crossiella equi]
MSARIRTVLSGVAVAVLAVLGLLLPTGSALAAASPATYSASATTVAPEQTFVLTATFTNPETTPVIFLWQGIHPAINGGAWTLASCLGCAPSGNDAVAADSSPVLPGESRTIQATYKASAGASGYSTFDGYVYYESGGIGKDALVPAAVAVTIG